GNPVTNQKNVSGFWLAGGVNIRAIDCTAVGVLGDKNASGFEWPSQLNHEPENVWIFQDNVSHNNFRQGIFIWQNDDNDHIVERTTIYHAGDHGVNWGAYSNPYVFRDGLIKACGSSAVAQHVTGQPSDTGQLPRWERVIFDASGADHCLEIVRTHVESEAKVLYLDCVFTGQLASAVSVTNDNTLGVWQEIDFVNTGAGTDLLPDDFELGAVAPGTIIRIQRADGSADQMDDQGRWTPIASFHQATSPPPPVSTSTTTSATTTTGAPGSTTTLAADEHGHLQGLVDQAQDALSTRKLGSLQRALDELETVLDAHAGS
ncbi:MAG: hypothetical protein ACRDXD_01020, partial [Acidimicrobiia bacterium]